ncbi:MAG: epoxide hydrolase [Candidatus Tectomicrobia bacterium]|uniref:Epoxide hydrolase n=1 Tax=Tectimicrobiota bacterium TaxID=2528274 RepID=A0A933GK19_UNCTE|nr:epoxide hydrolase [Candidatus Tectomicrobia bacterium]
MHQNLKPEPFIANIPEPSLEDLRRRLEATRWPDEIPGTGWRYGANLSYLKELVTYWREHFDWRKQEQVLNSFSQYRMKLGDITLHFIHQPGKGPSPLPLLFSHGWPGSVFEFVKIIGPLTDPARHGGDPRDSFTVVVPSLPGYGFSHKPTQPRVNLEETAELFAHLMTDVLGYSRFAAQGGDWGSFITSRLGYAYPDRVIGIHLNMLSAAPHPSERNNLTAAEKSFLKEAADFLKEESGYQWIQGTKPQTLAYALNDSPAGLAAWIVEKFHTWTDCHGDLDSHVSKDEILSIITLYWLTGTINSSFWYYYQMRHHPWRLNPGERIRVPTAVAAFPLEILRPPKEWAARIYDLRRWTDMPSGGHFPALEEPQRLVEDIRLFFRELR